MEQDLISVQIDEEGFLGEIKKIANPKNFLEFLELCAHNITMSFRNQIFLYKQAKDIYNACGIKAREEYGSPITDDINSATILYYNLKMEEDSSLKVEYIPIEVVGDTPETYTERPFEQPIPDMIAQFGIVVEIVPKAKLLHPANKADYNIDEKWIQVANGLNRQQYAETLIKAFTKMRLETLGITDKVVQQAVTYVVSKYFKTDAQKGIQGVLFQQAFSYDPAEFAEFLEEVSKLSFIVVEDLIGQLLSFDETSIINAYLTEDNFDVFAEELLMLQERTDDKSTHKTLSELAEKFNCSTLDSIEYLLAQKDARGAVYTFPPFRFERRQDLLF